MASKIKIKRSSSTNAPTGVIEHGELAVSFGAGTQGNNGERLFVGNSSNTPVIIVGHIKVIGKKDNRSKILLRESQLAGPATAPRAEIWIRNK